LSTTFLKYFYWAGRQRSSLKIHWFYMGLVCGMGMVCYYSHAGLLLVIVENAEVERYARGFGEGGCEKMLIKNL
jgi:hypothetical protein